MKMSDPVINPAHYAGKIECKDAMRSMMENGRRFREMEIYWWGCAFKYLWRWPRKNGAEDLEKCKQCIDYLIEEINDA